MSKIEYELDVPIRDLTTYKTQGTTPVVVYPKSISDCKIILEKLKQLNLGFFVVGKGSNLLISPSTSKICINLSKMKEKIRIKGKLLTVSSNLSLAKVFLACKKSGLSGMEKLCTIPASVGGAIKNNASFMGEEAFSHLSKLTILNEGKIVTFKKLQCDYSYRSSSLPKGIILSATFELEHKNNEAISKLYQEAASYRNKIQPKGFSCGCVFKNPQNQSAGKLIERCGLKGKERGDAIISPQHANFIINRNNATFDDVKYLIEYCEEEVEKHFGIFLEREVEIIE